MNNHNNNKIIAKLVKEAQDGNKESLDRLAEFVQGKVFAYFYRLTLDSDISQELLQETLLEMVKSLKKLRRPDRFWPWLWWLAFSKAQIFFKKRKNNKVVPMSSVEKDSLFEKSAAEDYNDGLSVMIRKEMSEATISALDMLKYSQRNILILRCFEQMSYADIAKQMECKETRVRALFFRAKKTLKKQLSKQGFGKNMMLAALGLFANITRDAEAAVPISIPATSLEVGFTGVVLGTLGTKLGMILTTMVTGAALTIGGIAVSNQTVEEQTSQIIPSKVLSVASGYKDTFDVEPESKQTPISSNDTIPETQNQPAAVGIEEQIKAVLSIQQAIDNAKHGDVVIIEDGIYTGKGNYDIDFSGKAITLKSANGPENCIIDCQKMGRGFIFETNEGNDSVLDGFRIINGTADHGGGIYCVNSAPSIKNCIIESNYAAYKGGGVYGCNGPIDDSEIVRNASRYYGGGFFNCDGNITNCIISENRAEQMHGGGLHGSDGTIRGCIISGNSAGHTGGGLVNCNANIIDCIISDNSSGNYYGGGGGGLFGCNGSITNCTIVNNAASGTGTNVCGCGNEADNKGGGLYNGSVIINSIIWGNQPDQINGGKDWKGSVVTYSNVEGGYAGKGNIDQEPRLFMSAGRPYYPAADSPCIDAGDPNYIPDDFEADITLIPRSFGGRIDMGAYEYIDVWQLIAYAGPDQSYHDIRSIALDGSDSYKYNRNQELSFQWNQACGPSIELQNSNTAEASFIPVEQGDYLFELVVSDSFGRTGQDELYVTVGANERPMADAGDDVVFDLMVESVTLDGSYSYDDDEDRLSYYWQQRKGPDVKLVDPNSMAPWFAPTEIGTYIFELIVNDGFDDSFADTVAIFVGSDKLLMANAGPFRYAASEPIELDGSRSHTSDGSVPTEYRWRKVSGPAGVFIEESNSATPTIKGFAQTNEIQICEFELIVSDGERESLPDNVEVIIVPASEYNKLVLESEVFDTEKATIIYFGGVVKDNQGKLRWDSPAWEEKANIISFEFYIDGWPVETQPRIFEKCGDMIIAYLSRVAPEYDKAIQTIGYRVGGMPALDVARYINTTYQDIRYNVNRVTLIHFQNRMLYEAAKNINILLLDGFVEEPCWVDNYITEGLPDYLDGTILDHLLNVTFESQDQLDNLQWYKNSLTMPAFNNYNNGLVAGSYWSVVGDGKDYQFPVDDGNVYNFRWYGDSNGGYMGLDDRFDNSKGLQQD